MNRVLNIVAIMGMAAITGMGVLFLLAGMTAQVDWPTRLSLLAAGALSMLPFIALKRG